MPKYYPKRPMIAAVVLFLVTIYAAVSPSAEESGPQASTRPFGGQRSVIPGKIEAEHFDLGAAEKAYHDVDAQNRGAKYREKTQVDIEKRSDASNGHGIGWTKPGEWLLYSVTIKKAGKYTLQIPVACDKTGGKLHLELAGKNITGPIRIPDTGGWDKLKTLKKTGIQLPAGDHQLKLMMDTAGELKSTGDIDCLEFTR